MTVPRLARIFFDADRLTLNSPNTPDMTTPATSKGLEGVVAANTRLSDVRGDIGQLIYCGYDIDELAGQVSYEEVVHLLHHNHLPNRAELEELKGALAAPRNPQGGARHHQEVSEDHAADARHPHGRLRSGVL